MHSLPLIVIRSLILTLLITSTYLVTQTVQAQETVTEKPTSTMSEQTHERAENAHENIATRTDALREEVQARKAAQEEVREERSAGLRQVALDRIQNLLENIVRRMHAAVARLEDVARRLASRADKIAETYSVDVSAAHMLINDAENELATTKVLLENLIDDTNGTLGEPNPRAQFARVRSALSEAANHIRTAHRMLREAVASLKTALGTAHGTGGASDAVRNKATSSIEIIEE